MLATRITAFNRGCNNHMEVSSDTVVELQNDVFREPMFSPIATSPSRVMLVMAASNSKVARG